MQPLSWYVNRLARMSPGEVLWRSKHAFADRLAQFLPVGSVPTPQSGRASLPPWPVPAIADTQPYQDAAGRILQGQIDLFGQWVKLKDAERDWNVDPTSGIAGPMSHGTLVDFRDESLVGSARAVWEVNRHYQIVNVAQAWALCGNERYRAGALQLLASWLKACPYPLGINWTSALEPGIRLVNWYLAARMLQIDPARDAVAAPMVESVFRHCEFIWTNQSRYSSANNHLIGEMAGLFVASCGWPCWPQSARWRADAKRILEREAQRQVHEDGVGREQTVSYQMFVLQFLIIAGLVGEVSGEPFSREYWAIVRKMIEFLRAIADAGDHLPDFGDADDGVVFVLSPDGRNRRFLTLKDLDTAFSGSRSVSGSEEARRAEDESAGWLTRGFPVPAHWPVTEPGQRRELARAFPEGGYFVLGEHFGTAREALAVLDAAPLGYLSIAAHGHADCLSFTLSLAGEQILIDPGTYCYHTEPEWRTYFRSTAAHNTLRVDGRDQSEMSGAFMWSHKAAPAVESVQLEGARQRVRARHNGYMRLADPVLHTRELLFNVGDAGMDEADELACNGPHEVERFWHVAEECSVKVADEHTVVIDSPRASLTLRCEGATRIEVARGSEKPRLGWVSRHFGLRAPTTTLILRDSIKGATTLRTALRWKFP
ncbi:MAG: alginate lyase family protein [Gammaproteobacteria bacterium]